MFVYINNPKFFNDDRFSGKLIAGTIYIMHKEVSGEDKKGHKIWRKVKDVDLGHGIWVNPLNRNNVICFNDTRGIYEVCIKNEKKKLNEDEDEILYDAVDVNDPRIQHHPKHAVIIQPSHGMEFGGTYLLLYCLYQFDYFTVLRKSLKDDRLFSQALVIISNNIQSGKEKIKPSTYYQSSIISYCVNRVSLSTIDSDTRLRQSLAVPVFKETFTENYVNTMRKKYPDFATCAAVDSMPYTSKAKNNPGVAKSSHGTGSVEQQIRVQKILDLDSGFPIWFDTFPGNSSDSVSLPSVLTSMQVGAHVFLNEMDLDAGYICRSLLNLRNLNNPAIISPDGKEVTNLLLVRLPTSDTYGLGEIYHNIRDELFDVNSIFQLNGSLYHGVKIKGEVLHYPEYIYFYVDVKRAYEKMIKILSEEQEAWDKLSEEEKQWNSIAGGVFMLASNNPDPSCTAKSTLCDYHKRYGIEADNRLQKTTVGGMPLGTHYDSTSNGEIMLDHMSTIGAAMCNWELSDLDMSFGEALFAARAVKCDIAGDEIIVRFPPPNVRRIFEKLGIPFPASIHVDDLKNLVLNGQALPEFETHSGSKRKRPVSLIQSIPCTDEMTRTKREEAKAEKKRKEQLEKEMQEAYEEKCKREAQNSPPNTNTEK